MNCHKHTCEGCHYAKERNECEHPAASYRCAMAEKVMGCRGYNYHPKVSPKPQEDEDAMQP